MKSLGTEFGQRFAELARESGCLSAEKDLLGVRILTPEIVRQFLVSNHSRALFLEGLNDRARSAGCLSFTGLTSRKGLCSFTNEAGESTPGATKADIAELVWDTFARVVDTHFCDQVVGYGTANAIKRRCKVGRVAQEKQYRREL